MRAAPRPRSDVAPPPDLHLTARALPSPSSPPVKFLQRPLAQVISTIRAPKSAEGYRAIGGGSPLLRITNEQAAALGAALSARGVDARVYVGMRYWRPFMEDAVAALQADGVTDLIVLPLYPQFSISTSGSSLRLLEAMMDDNPAGLGALRHAVVSSWYWREGYLSAMAGLIGRELAAFPDPDAVEIFFSAHGVPVSYVRDGDPYQAEMEDCVDLIMDRVRSTTGRDVHHTLAYQSRVGPVEWLTPYTDVKIRELAADGCKALLAVPVSFVSEHIETLEEIDVEYRELAESVGITQWRRVPALNTEPLFIDDLAALVIDKLPACAQRPGYAGSEGGSLQSAQQRAAAGLGGGGGSPAAPADKGASMLAAGEGASLGPPTGTVRAVLKTYDRERRTLPPPSLTRWAWGWTRSAETWNGRIAMVAILAVVLLEAATGEGVLARWLSLK
jgi:ferrochelatase